MNFNSSDTETQLLSVTTTNQIINATNYFNIYKIFQFIKGFYVR